MKNKDTYFAQQQKEKTKQLNTLIKRLPPFAVDYFNHIAQSTAINTQVAYAGNIILFLEFLIQSNPVYKNYHTTDFQLKDLEQL